MEKIEVIERAANRLLQHNVAEARRTIETEYPFHKLTAQGRNYTDKEKMAQFVRDGLTGLFIKLVETDNELLEDFYIKRWYQLSVAVERA